MPARFALPATAVLAGRALSRTQRAEGAAQATYNRWPLYYYVGDLEPGDVDGEGADGVWFAVAS